MPKKSARKKQAFPPWNAILFAQRKIPFYLCYINIIHLVLQSKEQLFFYVKKILRIDETCVLIFSNGIFIFCTMEKLMKGGWNSNSLFPCSLLYTMRKFFLIREKNIFTSRKKNWCNFCFTPFQKIEFIVFVSKPFKYSICIFNSGIHAPLRFLILIYKYR